MMTSHLAPPSKLELTTLASSSQPPQSPPSDSLILRPIAMSITNTPTPLSTPARQDILQHSAFKGAQAASLIVPPVYVLYSLTKSTFSINHLLRATAIGCGLIGPAIGAGMAVAKLGGMGEAEAVMKDGKLRASVSRFRTSRFAIL